MFLLTFVSFTSSIVTDDSLSLLKKEYNRREYQSEINADIIKIENTWEISVLK